jgi:hypothetical protein
MWKASAPKPKSNRVHRGGDERRLDRVDRRGDEGKGFGNGKI